MLFIQKKSSDRDEGHSALGLVSQDHREEVTCVSFNANDSYIASGSTSGDLVLHSLTTNQSSKAFGHGSNQVRPLLTVLLLCARERLTQPSEPYNLSAGLKVMIS